MIVSVAHRHDAQPRPARADLAHAGASQSGKIDGAQALAGAAHRHGGIAVAAGRQHTVAGIDGGERLARRPCVIFTVSNAATLSVPSGIGRPASMRSGICGKGAGA